MPFTLVSFHAHPDDEALLTAGTLARAAAEGHRVVLVVATAGEAGLASTALPGGTADELAGSLAERRVAELHRSAEALGCARVELLGYGDSGLDPAPAVPRASPAVPGNVPFSTADVEQAAERLAALLHEERADVLTVYDAAGGYGHPDHVQVHRVGIRAAELAHTPVVLEATVDGDLLRRVLRALGRLRLLPAQLDQSSFDTAYTRRPDLTHRVDVRRYAGQKRASMAAHASQATADAGDRTLAAFLRLPRPLFRRAFGAEWFVERGRRPTRPLLGDVFASLRAGPPPDTGPERGD